MKTYRIWCPEKRRWFRGAKFWRWTRYRYFAAACDDRLFLEGYWMPLAQRHCDQVLFIKESHEN